MKIDGMHEKDIFKEKFPFRLAENQADDFDYPHHWHSAIELLYVLENSYAIQVNGTEVPLLERDIYFIAGGDIHGFGIRNTKGRRFFIQFDLSRLESFIDLNALKPYLLESKRISPLQSADFHKALEEQILHIIQAYNQKDLAYNLYINARVYDILILLSRGFFRSTSAEERIKRSKIPGLDKLNIALKYIEEHYLEPLTLDEVASVAGFSRYYFSRVFKDITEKNFHEYLNEFRIKQAEKLLTDIGTTITQAAYASGFNSIATFNRLFKRMKGCSPADYRKMKI